MTSTFSIRKRALIGVAGAGVIAAGAAGVMTVQAQSPQPAAQAPAPVEAADANLQSTTRLTVGAATKAAQGALDAAAEAGQRVSVAVVDRDGNVIVQLRGDGSGPQSFESAEQKAYTAVSWNAPTSQLSTRLDSTPRLADIPGTLFLAGGAPVTAHGAPIAGIGVAGAPSGDQDEAFAKAGLAALGR
ncbi:GlcG/HbpS family heme-binding protein [Nocardia wallacei]|uniref:GlcG/HbpS family heme-binding protein n=1 Tax=Nocardia wallacei TaxID=480035 RepID=UPI00245588F3|nr:heme-binding protein [Nocardia wallacei]